jgi:hypothetical protein
MRWKGSVPLVCLNETRTPVPMKKGQPARVGYEYERNGTADMFMMFAPLEGWRYVKVIESRSAIDYAQALEDLSDVHFPIAKKIGLAQDKLNTPMHRRRSLIFPPAEARRLGERFEWHYTPKHGAVDLTLSNPNSASWPHSASITVPDRSDTRRGSRSVAARSQRPPRQADWHFTTEKAHVKLKHLCPSL